MRNIVKNLIAGIAITAIGAFAADNSVGTWKLNMEKSKFSPASPVKSLTATREAANGGVKVVTSGERADGTAINSSYTAKFDGKEYPVTGSPYDSIALKQVDASKFTFTAKKAGGKYNVLGRMVVSKDGKTLTSTVKGANADGKPYHATLVYDKQ